MTYTVGLDLGTFYTRIWAPEQGIVLRCPSAVALDSRSHAVVALGAEACRMIGRTPDDILAYRPVQGGVVADFEAASRMVEGFFAAKRLCTLFKRPRVMISSPYRIQQVAQLALENAVLEAGARSVAQVPAAFAAAVGENLQVKSSGAHMVLSMGAGVAESVVISSGNIIHAKSLAVAGERLNMAIISYVKNRFGLLIDESTAEHLKLRLGTADPRIDRGELEIRGRNARTKLAERRVITSEDICEAITPAVNAVAKMLVSTVEETPTEIAGELYVMGVLLTGGCALLPGMAKALSRRSGLRVVTARDPMDSVIRGLSKISERPSLLGDQLMFRRR